MKRLLPRLGAWLVVSCTLAGCTDGDDASPSNTLTPVCQAGLQTECACAGGTSGVQRCRDDGSGWSECECPDSAPAADASSQPDVGSEVLDSTVDEPDADAGLAEAAADATVEQDADADAEDSSCLPPARDCSGICVNTSIDPANCGACGHSCQGGECVGGACQPTILASGQPGALRLLAVDDDYVYWTADTTGSGPGHISRVAKVGGQPEDLVTGLGRPARIALSTTHVFWTTADQYPGPLMRVPKLGGSPEVFASIDVFDTAPVAVSVDHVFWGSTIYGRLWYSATASSAPQEIASGQAKSPASIVVEGDWLYWNDSSDTKIDRVQFASAQPPEMVADYTTNASGSASNDAIGISGDFVYWAVSSYSGTGPGSGAILRAVKTGGQPEELKVGENSPKSVYVDADHVYWAAEGNAITEGTVRRMHTTTLQVQVLASEQTSPHGIAGDSLAVYWVSYDKIMRLAK